MKVRHLSVQKAIIILKKHTEIPIYDRLPAMGNKTKLFAVKNWLQNNQLLLTSGARICYNEYDKANGHTGWFISGYAADGWDVDCYFDKKVYANMLKHKRLIPKKI